VIVRSWRIVKAKYARTAFSGAGAKTSGGRWNSPGTAVIYTAGSISLGILEMLVHLWSKDVLRHYVTFELSFDEAMLRRIPVGDLPRSWWNPRAPAACQSVGDEWARGLESPALALPSAIVRTEWNYLLNPAHPDFPKIKIASPQPVRLDKRLR
jgi:RES domain-containing protein